MIQDELSKVLDEGRAEIRQATTELKSVVREQSKAAARAIRAEADHVRRELGEFTGNGAPDDEDPEIAAENARLQAAEEAGAKVSTEQGEGSSAAVAQALPAVSPIQMPEPEPASQPAPQPVEPAAAPLPPGMPAADWRTAT